MPISQRHLITVLVPLLLIAVCASPLAAQRDTTKATPTAMDTASTMVSSAAAAVQWGDLKAEGVQPGAKIAVIHGDPSGTGDYTVRLQFPDGYRFPVHWHPKAEHVTVLSGNFILGMGSTINAANEKTYGAGDFLYIPARHPHAGGARGATVIQLHGMGPFTIMLGAPPG